MQALLSGFGQGCALISLAVASHDIGLLDALGAHEETSVECLAGELDLDVGRLLACLTLLERVGCVARVPSGPQGGGFKRTRRRRPTWRARPTTAARKTDGGRDELIRRRTPASAARSRPKRRATTGIRC